MLTRNGELVQQIDVVTCNADGEPLLESLEHLTESQRTVAINRYANVLHTRRTEGAFVDKAGEPVTTDPETGKLPEGAISQRLFFNGITLGMLKKKGLTVNDNSSVVGLLCALIQQEMANLDKRGVY